MEHLILAKKGTFLKKIKNKNKNKKGTTHFTTPNSIPIQSVLHQNKVLHSFYKKGQLSDYQIHKRSRLLPECPFSSTDTPIFFAIYLHVSDF